MPNQIQSKAQSSMFITWRGKNPIASVASEVQCSLGSHKFDTPLVIYFRIPSILLKIENKFNDTS